MCPLLPVKTEGGSLRSLHIELPFLEHQRLLSSCKRHFCARQCAVSCDFFFIFRIKLKLGSGLELGFRVKLRIRFSS